MSPDAATCTLVNRFYPPNPSITGHAAAELAGFLSAAGIRVTSVSVDGRYSGGVSGSDGSSHGGGEVARVGLPAVCESRRALPRLAGALVEGWALARTLDRGVVIGLTDPPLLNWWLARHCARKKIPWICWSMDLYPDAFASAGLISRDHFIYRGIYDRLRRHPPQHLIALGRGQAAYLRQSPGWNVPTTILPCGIHSETRAPEPPAWHPGPQKIVLGYLGNIGQAHDPQFVSSVMRALNPEKHLLVLSTYGAHTSRLLQEASHHHAVKIVDHVPRHGLGWIDIHLVSLDPGWDHVCVPSKAVSAVCSGAALLGCLTDGNDTWQQLGRAGWRISPTSDLDSAVREWIRSLSPEDLAARKREAESLALHLRRQRDHAFAEIEAAVRNLSRAHRTPRTPVAA